MKKSILGLVAIGALIATPAMAADMALPLKAPFAPPPVVASWTGFYIGIEGGGGWGNENWLDNSTTGCPPCVGVTHHPDGGILGGQIGARYQFSNNIVIGVEGTAAWASLSDTVSTATAAFFPTETEQFKVNSLYTATGQVGYAFNQALLYVKGGWAGANTNWMVNAPVALAPNTPFTASNSQSNSGWTVGVGLDYQLWNNFVAGIEYDHFDLAYSDFTAAVSNGGTPFLVTDTSRLTIDQVVGRLSYKFNWTPAPIATRY